MEPLRHPGNRRPQQQQISPEILAALQGNAQQVNQQGLGNIQSGVDNTATASNVPDKNAMLQALMASEAAKEQERQAEIAHKQELMAMAESLGVSKEQMGDPNVLRLLDKKVSEVKQQALNDEAARQAYYENQGQPQVQPPVQDDQYFR